MIRGGRWAVPILCVATSATAQTPTAPVPPPVPVPVDGAPPTATAADAEYAAWLLRAESLPDSPTLPATTWQADAGIADVARLAADERASPYTPIRRGVTVWLGGQLRGRTHGHYNLDLDRGIDAAGKPLYPIPADGLMGEQLGVGADARLRLDVGAMPPAWPLAVKARVDVGDNLTVGTRAESARRTPALVMKRLWVEFLTPLGGFAAGRSGTHFGLGLVAHGGDCEDCDGGDAADRIAWALTVKQHLIAVSWDFQLVDGLRSRDSLATAADLFEPTLGADVQTLLIGRFSSNSTRQRLLAAGRSSVEYAAYVAHSSERTANDMRRDMRGWGAGGWLRWVTPRVRVEVETAALTGTIGQPSLVPGIELTQDATFSQLGAALESEVKIGPVVAGLGAGYASGDRAPGFGVTNGAEAAPAGSLDGAQFDFPRDTHIGNFRFARDYRIDLILFREMIGTVTDAWYLRPTVSSDLWRVGAGTLTANVAGIWSHAVEPTSTLSGARALGLEIDTSLAWRAPRWHASLAHGILWPGAGLDAPSTAQAWRATVGVLF